MDKKRILIIDDEANFTKLVKLNLELTGRYEVIFSNEAKEGIELAKIQKPDLILLDIRMPDMDGAEVAQHLSEDETTKKITVVFLSAVAIPMAFLEGILKNETIKQNTEYDEGHYFIQKPVTPKELVERLDSILDKKR